MGCGNNSHNCNNNDNIVCSSYKLLNIFTSKTGLYIQVIFRIKYSGQSQQCCMVSILPLISKSSGDCYKGTIIGITITLMFHNFLSSQARSIYLFIFLLSFIFTQCFTRIAKSTREQVRYFLLINIRSGLLDKIRRSICISKSKRILCILFSRIDSSLWPYHLAVWSNFNFLHNSQWITFLTQSCLVSYLFCNSLLHSLIMWLTVSSLSL